MHHVGQLFVVPGSLQVTAVFAALHTYVPQVPHAPPGVGMICPHPPQLLAVSHVPLQSIVVLGHMQLPLVHCSVLVHTVPHDPQLFLSLFLFVHALPQKSGLAAIEHAHTPDWHVSAAGQAFVHVPQLAWSVCVLVHAEPHSVGVAVGQTHVPDGQVWLAAQTVPHVPQFFGSVAGVVHVPLQLV